MRKVIIGTVAATVLAGGAAGAVWYKNASLAKKIVAERLSTLKEGEKFNLTYDSLSASGFPFALNIAIVNPHVTGQMNKIFEGKDIKNALGTDTLPEWIEDYALNGSVVFSVNAFSDKLGLKIDGDVVGKGIVDGKTVSFASPTNLTCSLRLEKKSGGGFWSFAAIERNSRELSETFRNLDCNIAGAKAVNSETQEEVFSHDGLKFNFSRNVKDDATDLRLALQIKDAEATKAYDGLVKPYYDVFAKGAAFTLPSIFGKQNIEIDISYNGPDGLKGNNLFEKPIDIKINKIAFSNALYSGDAKFLAKTSVNGNVRDAAIDLSLESSANELYNATVKDMIRNAVAAVNSAEAGNPAELEMRKKLAAMSSEELDKIVSAVLPDFAALGKLVFAVKADYSGDKSFSEFSGNLLNLDISATPYGVTATGSVKRSKETPLPVGNISVVCKSCVRMIDDAVAYFVRAKDAMALLDPKFASVNFDPAVVEGVKKILLAIGVQEADGDKVNLKFDIVSGKTPQPTINGKSAAEIMQIVGQNMAPAMPQGGSGAVLQKNANPVAPKPAVAPKQ